MKETKMPDPKDTKPPEPRAPFPPRETSTEFRDRAKRAGYYEAPLHEKLEYIMAVKHFSLEEGADVKNSMTEGNQSIPHMPEKEIPAEILDLAQSESRDIMQPILRGMISRGEAAGRGALLYCKGYLSAEAKLLASEEKVKELQNEVESWKNTHRLDTSQIKMVEAERDAALKKLHLSEEKNAKLLEYLKEAKAWLESPIGDHSNDWLSAYEAIGEAISAYREGK